MAKCCSIATCSVTCKRHMTAAFCYRHAAALVAQVVASVRVKLNVESEVEATNEVPLIARHMVRTCM